PVTDRERPSVSRSVGETEEWMRVAPRRALDHLRGIRNLVRYPCARQRGQRQVVHRVVADRIRPADRAGEVRVRPYEMPCQKERRGNVIALQHGEHSWSTGAVAAPVEREGDHVLRRLQADEL